MPETPSFALALPARPASLTVIRHVLGGVSGVWTTMTAELLEDVRIAVSEVCSGAITHAEEEDAGMLHVVVANEPEGLEVSVRSRGPGIVGPPASPEDDLGLHLIRALVSDIELRRLDDGSAHVRMVFAEDAP